MLLTLMRFQVRVFTDKVDALASYTVMSNMKTRVISYNRNKIKDVVYNGQYMLGVSVTDVQISQFQISEYAIDVFTDVPAAGQLPLQVGRVGSELMMALPVGMLQRLAHQIVIHSLS